MHLRKIKYLHNISTIYLHNMLHVWYGVDHESKFPGKAEGGEG